MLHHSEKCIGLTCAALAVFYMYVLIIIAEKVKATGKIEVNRCRCYEGQRAYA